VSRGWFSAKASTHGNQRQAKKKQMFWLAPPPPQIINTNHTKQNQNQKPKKKKKKTLGKTKIQKLFCGGPIKEAHCKSKLMILDEFFFSK
jgi:hypothetical protein